MAIYLNVSGGVVSDSRLFKTGNKPDIFVTFFAAVIVMDHGKPISIYWDENNCSECDVVYCVGVTCGLGYSDLNNCTNTQDCNMIVRSFFISNG
jgi:hypothetical protein